MFAFVAVVFIILPIRRDFLLKGDIRYTYGEVVSIENVVNGGPDAKFRYCANNEVYVNTKDIGMYKDIISIGDTVIIKYSNKNPKTCTLYIDTLEIGNKIIDKMNNCY